PARTSRPAASRATPTSNIGLSSLSASHAVPPSGAIFRTLRTRGMEGPDITGSTTLPSSSTASGPHAPLPTPGAPSRTLHPQASGLVSDERAPQAERSNADAIANGVKQ